MIDTMKLRKFIGWLGMFLPWIVAALAIYETKKIGLPGSISETYYLATCNAPFMIILGSAAMLLICYDGYTKQDAIICSLAGVFGFMICLFPCWTWKYDLVSVLNLSPNTSVWVHNCSAFAFFGLLAYNSLFLFTKTSGEITAQKRKRNIIFIICGIGMVGSFLLLIPLWTHPNGVWIVETIALSFFGISWLTKSQCYSWLFKDKK